MERNQPRSNNSVIQQGFSTVIYDVYVMMWRQAEILIKTHQSSGSSRDKEEKKLAIQM